MYRYTGHTDWLTSLDNNLKKNNSSVLSWFTTTSPTSIFFKIFLQQFLLLPRQGTGLPNLTFSSTLSSFFSLLLYLLGLPGHDTLTLLNDISSFLLSLLLDLLGSPKHNPSIFPGYETSSS